MNPFSLLLLKLAAVGLPVIALAYGKRVYPHRPLVFCALAPALSSLVLSPFNFPLWPLYVLDGLVVVLAAIDLLTLPRKSAFEVERGLRRVASVRRPHQVELTVSNRSKRSFFVWLRDDADAELQPDPDEFTLSLAPRSRATVHYEIRSKRRGAFNFDHIYIRVRSRLGLWQRFLTYPVESLLHVYPDMKQLSQYAVLARTDRLSLLGMRRTRKIGQDNEFERLRDYSIDDNFKHIDWRSTARRRKLTVKDFQQTQNQRLIFLVDCGRMMTNQAAGLSFLDHAYNAALMLSYVALSRGDSVGMLSFSDQIHGYVPPKSGMGQMNHLLHASFDRFPHLVESRFDEAFLYLSAHCRKRSLVILITNVIDDVNGNQIEQYLSNLTGKHLPLGVLLRDRRLFEMAEFDLASVQTDETGRPVVGKDFYSAAAAADILNWRQGVLADLESRGVLMLDVFPEDLTAPLINRYMDIKARHLL